MSRPEQLEVSGTERVKIKAIEDAASKYVDVRDKRMSLTEKEVAAKATLVDVMQRHADKLGEDGDGNRVYRFGDEMVILSDKINVKVRHAAEPEADED